MKSVYCIFLSMLALVSCTQNTPPPLDSWVDNELRKSIVKFVEVDAQLIPVEDRIAVFDLDGTLACETPLWFEMYVAVAGLNEKSLQDSSLLQYPEYKYAKLLAANPFDTTVLSHWGTLIDSMVLKAFEGTNNEVYVEYSNSYLNSTTDPKFGKPLAKLFYKPMLELLEYLTDNKFSIYVVSGSSQGLLWSICPDVIGLERNRLIGTRTAMYPNFNAKGGTAFELKKGIFPPKNDGFNKALNIYSYIGKTPVFAFGNTTGDFGMFHLASTNKYPNMSLMLNHDDSDREYAYPPYHGPEVKGWLDSLNNNGWHLVSMTDNFSKVWID
ncbi:MAG: haloacid dehalogenase-like hydrolase [Bacteroidales bacterium]|nr:haloacid dehalogenase-like hydrolase [Bacteroidales bacterium]MBN2747992.1 haloacid dehalogenase-like hydrolase [Bacteroidales bacterium]